MAMIFLEAQPPIPGAACLPVCLPACLPAPPYDLAVLVYFKQINPLLNLSFYSKDTLQQGGIFPGRAGRIFHRSIEISKVLVETRTLLCSFYSLNKKKFHVTRTIFLSGENICVH